MTTDIKTTKKSAIMDYYWGNPTKNYADIAEHFGVTRQYVSKVTLLEGITNDYTSNRIKLANDTNEVQKVLKVLGVYTTRQEIEQAINSHHRRASEVVSKLHIQLSGNKVLRYLSFYEKTESDRETLGTYGKVALANKVTIGYVQGNKGKVHTIVSDIDASWLEDKRSLNKVVGDFIEGVGTPEDLLKKVIQDSNNDNLDLLSYLYTVLLMDSIKTLKGNTDEINLHYGGLVHGDVTDETIDKLQGIMEQDENTLGEHIVITQQILEYDGGYLPETDTSKNRQPIGGHTLTPDKYNEYLVYNVYTRDWI